MSELRIPSRTITFNPIAHTYVDEYGKPYTPVTAVCQSYSKPFDEEYWARKKAIERGVSKAQVKQEWTDNRNAAAAKGTRTHNYLEEAVDNIYEDDSNVGGAPIHEIVTVTTLSFYRKIDSMEALENSPLRRTHSEIYSYLVYLITSGFILFTEKRLYSPHHLIAGTTDVIAIRGKEFIIVDWKTNKELISFTAGYYKKKWANVGGEMKKVKTDIWVPKTDKMLYPVNKLPDCKGSIYTLQTGLYAYLAELWGFKCIGIVIWQIFDAAPPVKHPVKYVKEEVINMVNHFVAKRDKGEEKNKPAFNFGIFSNT